MTALLDNPATTDAACFDGAYRGRRLSWSEFFALRPDLRADNDNQPKAMITAPKCRMVAHRLGRDE